MAKQLNVFGTAMEAVAFPFTNYTTILGQTWAWILIYIVAMVAVFGLALGSMIGELASGSADPMQMQMQMMQSPAYALANLGSVIISFVVYAGIMPPLMRLVVTGDDVGFKFWSGSASTQVLIAYLVFLVLMIPVSIVLAIVAGGYAFLMGSLGILDSGIGIALSVVFGLVLGVIFLGLLLRIGLIVPIAALEEKLGLGQAFSMSSGKTIALGLYALLAYIVFAIAFMIIYLVVALAIGLVIGGLTAAMGEGGIIVGAILGIIVAFLIIPIFFGFTASLSALPYRQFTR